MKLKPPYLLLLLLFVIGLEDMLGQQESQFAQYTYNTMAFNPAYAGGRGRATLMTLYRQQWAGIEGAPQTFSLSADTPVGASGKVNLGLEFVNDRIGPSEKNIFAANFAYVIAVNNQIDFSFGLKAGIHTLDIDRTKLNIFDPNNVNINLTNKLMPVAGVGFYLYSYRWYLGLSSPNLLQTKHYDDVMIATANEKMHFYLLGGYSFYLSDEIQLRPSAMIKEVAGAPIAVTTAVKSVFYDRFVLGIAYNFEASVGALAGFEITDYIMLGYAYEYSTTAISRYNHGSHEFFLRFQLEPGYYPNRISQEF